MKSSEPRSTIAGVSLLWRILLSTTLAITLLFAIAGWMIQNYAARVSQSAIEGEIGISLRSYQALWATRAANLASIARVMSSMSDVRAAFMTRDQATIRDTAEQLWAMVSAQDAGFLVLEPTGRVIASLGGQIPELSGAGRLMAAALKKFPTQSSGYATANGRLYYVVLTPVYVQTSGDPALLNVLLIALAVNDKLAAELKRSTDGTDFSFSVGDTIAASTVPLTSVKDLHAVAAQEGRVARLVAGGAESLVLRNVLRNTQGEPVAELFIIRSFAGPQQAISGLQRNVALIWLLAIATGVLLTYLLTKRILRPVERLDRAAEEVIRRNYSYRVPIESQDELGRLATTFNAMCDSIQQARDELIRGERIATIGRLSTSIVHDLRNPLAAIYGGAEMLVDADLSPEQYRRLAANIYRASRRIQELLQELLDVSRSNKRPIEASSLADIVAAAVESVAHPPEVSIRVDVAPNTLVMADHDRLTRVFMNLLANALEAMPEGGTVTMTTSIEDEHVVVAVQDTGHGISPEAWPTLFQPFSSFGKKNGLGLGLALARQTVADHGGELWAEQTGPHPGACFHLRLPIAKPMGTDVPSPSALKT
jgi:signal transduction histidine kinase